MRLVFSLIRCGDVAAFFFFSWVVMMLWNSIVADHLGMLPALSYLQTCGLWFLIMVLFSWTGTSGLAGGWTLRPWRRARQWDDVGRDVERRVKRGFARWAGASEDVDWDDLGPLIEQRLKRKFKEWIQEE